MRSVPDRGPRRGVVVAALVLVLASCTGGDGGASGAGAGGQQGEAPQPEADLVLVGTDTLRWEPERLTAETGERSIALRCEGGVNHNLMIDGKGQVAECGRGETVETSAELEAGTYEFACTIPGHQRTMQGELVVE